MRAAGCLVFVACVGLAAAAQAPAQAPVFRSGVKLVTLDVTVVDGDGKPVAGLTPADFTAKINGVAARVQTLDFQQFGIDRIADAPAPVATVPAVATAPVPPRSSRGPQTFLLLFDDRSFIPGAGKSLQFGVEKMLKQLDVSDLVGMTTTSALEAPVSPTRDRPALFAAIKRVTGRVTDTADPYFISALEISEIARGVPRTLSYVIKRECGTADAGGQCADRVAAHARRMVATALRQKIDQLNALRHAIGAMSQVPAPRVIVWLSGGISVDATPQVRDALEDLPELAARAGVQVYALFDEPDPINMNDRTPERTTARRDEGTFLLGGLQSAAGAAGGSAFRVIGQPDRFFSRIVSETSAIYRLGIELPPATVGTERLRTEVKVRRDGVHVRSSGRALADEPAAPLTRDAAIRMALEHGREAPGVALSVATRIRRDVAGGIQIMVDARLPGDVAAPITAAFGLLGADGQMVLQSRRDVTASTGREHQILFTMRAEAGDYRLRVVTADGADRIGSTEVPVSARLARAGPFALSDVLTVFHQADGAQSFSASDDIPPAAARLSATLELYPDVASVPSQATSVRVVLSTEGGAAALFDTTVTPLMVNDRWTATAEMPLADLAPGRYTVRMEVVHDGGIVGIRSRTLVKKRP